MNSDDTLASIRILDEKLEENAEQHKILVGLMTKGYLDRPVYTKSNSELLLYTSKANMLTAFDADLFEGFVDRIIVNSSTEIGFELKCSMTLRERSAT